MPTDIAAAEARVLQTQPFAFWEALDLEKGMQLANIVQEDEDAEPVDLLIG